MDTRFREVQTQDRRFSLQQGKGRIQLTDGHAPALQGIPNQPGR
ncbi:hypothetical protein [Arenibacter algicola]|nr:hypothetical protein [Arenibacter algicola]